MFLRYLGPFARVEVPDAAVAVDRGAVAEFPDGIGERLAAEQPDSWEAVDESDAAETDIRHVGGGWFELPDGERVQGKEEAAQRLIDKEGDA